jgi:hypothetical protein
MGSIGPDNSLNRTELENLDRLEAVVRRGLDTYAEVGEALAEIRDAQLYRETHRSFEAYLRERWGVNGPRLIDARDVPDPPSSLDAVSGRLLTQLRWRLAQSSGTIAHVAHQLETHPFELDEDARDQLRDDVLVIEEQMAVLGALLSSIDWDAEFERTLREELPRPETDADSDDD